jgi:hypothetical protein
LNRRIESKKKKRRSRRSRDLFRLLADLAGANNLRKIEDQRNLSFRIGGKMIINDALTIISAQ